MAWEWSHTAEAYYDARRNLENESREFLDVCLAEWQASREGRFQREFRANRYDRTLAWVQKQPADVVADMIWEKAEEQRTCDNGGWNAWMCPFGCHTVSFSCERTDD